MRAVTVREFGGPEVLQISELPDPTPASGEVLLGVAATAVNKGDTHQRVGNYPPPPGVTDVMGLECSGTVLAVGDDVTRWKPGDEVCALVAGGGYADRAVVPAGQVMPVPAGVDLISAAALPEAAATVWSNVFMESAMKPGETILVHGGAGGIGSFAISLAAARGHRVFATAGSPGKVATCLDLGADVGIDYRDEDFVGVVKEATGGRGVDVILDNMGASYLDRNLKTLATGGRLAIIGMQGGTRGDLNIGRLLVKRARVIATSLRPRPLAEKAAICSQLVEQVWPLYASGAIKPVIDCVMPLADVARAHERLEASSHTGKIVLVP
ncbi:NAD(P)H-quinone oxidoreductase [Gordonia terrae]|uniref:NAD(P)H-quinone oxidoreductase n=2 Tax=Gordonia terrae TaxID=2055 RepID=A0AAD0K4Q0_9ACTN|nr:NAD(P)H-quinone oxidoreductase [Gordonia terrae]VTR09164.1 alcohol dehydrogenase [Clostridioides difficile]ANY21845.1 NADPH:quinone oxidoreductase [Gordonia terrae]AWO82580.1 NAD(P)H-quinone oxidoreductase [Gordonia terrae]VTS22194.1 Quinone oxidoreductase 1 [Gordonia terrae]GAB44657.1 putative oxidoreductase [Gordonia terrae NBRC 100016]